MKLVKTVKMSIYIFTAFVLYINTVICTNSSFAFYSQNASYNILPALDMQITSFPYTVSVYEKQAISENCTRAAELFTESATNFTRCVSSNARPIRFCVNCENVIKTINESYAKFKKNVSNECYRLYFESDQIGVIALIYSQGESIWTKGNCQNCFDHMKDAETFLNISEEFNNCIFNANESSLHENRTCDLCHDLFVQLNNIYDLFIQKVSEGNGVCMDIVDQMNITRQIWKNQNCTGSYGNIGYPIIITAALVGSMPILFYLLSKNISIIEDVKLVRPKRKSLAAMASEQRNT